MRSLTETEDQPLAGPSREPPPDLVGGRFQLRRELGDGASGVVYEARDEVSAETVALKIFRLPPGTGPTRIEQGRRELRLARRVQHPGVVRLHELFSTPDGLALSMELVRGRTLKERLESGPLTGAALRRLAMQLADALAAAHTAGVVHRDLKPANILLAAPGDRVKVADFGISRLVDRFEPDDDASASGSGRSRGLVGTPAYMAPEQFSPEADAGPAADVYAFGLILFEAATGIRPHLEATTSSIADLARARRTQPAPPLGTMAPGIDPEVASVVDRALAMEPARRFASGQALVEALRAAAPGLHGPAPDGNPYPGLEAFESSHRGVFFGRTGETREVLDRLRASAFVLVTGDSGSGKSSLCRAGVLPAVRAGELDAEACTVIHLVPGRDPVGALADAARLLRTDTASEDARALDALVSALADARALVFVDQLEELLTLAPPAEAQRFDALLEALLSRTTRVRVLATIRSDFVGRLESLPCLGARAREALYLVWRLSNEGLRDAIVRPAEAKGVRLEDPRMVSELIAAARDEGGLPLLQFALAELWRARDEARRVIPAAALARMGGLQGALSQHADGIIAALSPLERAAARGILCRLVTASGTRARTGGAQLVGQDPTARTALEALVRGRLVVARDGEQDQGTFEIAHEALVTGWGTLRGWLAADLEARLVGERIEAAAAEWERLGLPRGALWSREQLAEVGELRPEQLGPAGTRFLEASRAAVRRARRLRLGAAIALPLLVGASAGGTRLYAHLEQSRRVGEWLARGDGHVVTAGRHVEAVGAARTECFREFDAARPKEGEAAWARVQAEAGRANAAFDAAQRALDTALQIDPGRGAVRARIAALSFDQALLAEQTLERGRKDELVRRMKLYDDGTQLRRWEAPAEIRVEATPAATSLTLIRYRRQDDGRYLTEPVDGASALVRGLALPPGSYRATLSAPGHVETHLPFVVDRGEPQHLEVRLPRQAEIPEGFVYVPAGTFTFGASLDEDSMRRDFYGAAPAHRVRIGAFLIARYETTWAEWIRYLESLDPSERARRTPKGSILDDSVQLHQTPRGWELTLTQRESPPRVAHGDEPIAYAGRSVRATQRWQSLPASGMTWQAARGYADWLERTAGIRGARLCTELEWERAARGADERSYPHGDRLEPEDANFDQTYGRIPTAFGPDEVGSHPIGRSPFGVDDLIGNVFEWTSSSLGGLSSVLRGGSYFYGSLMSRSYNREVVAAESASPATGMRLCAALQNLQL